MVCNLVSDINSINITHVENRDGDIDESQAGIDQARIDLEFEPTVSLKTGLRNLIL